MIGIEAHVFWKSGVLGPYRRNPPKPHKGETKVQRKARRKANAQRGWAKHIAAQSAS